MIELVVEPYCHECNRFEPVTERLYCNDCATETRIVCAYMDRCHLIENNIRREIMKEREKE